MRKPGLTTPMNPTDYPIQKKSAYNHGTKPITPQGLTAPCGAFFIDITENQRKGECPLAD